MPKRERTAQLLDEIPRLLPRGRVLDAGTGAGELAHGLMAAGYEVTACDIDPTACRFPDLPVDAVDLRSRLPYEDRAFDMVVATEVLEHMEDPFRVVREFYRVLRPSGLLLLTTPNYGNIEKRLQYLYAGELPTRLTYECHPPDPHCAHHHITPWTVPRLRYLLETNGFKVQAFTTANPKTKIWLLAPLVGLIWLYVHVLWSRRRREHFFIRDQMKVILGGRSLVVISHRAAG